MNDDNSQDNSIQVFRQTKVILDKYRNSMLSVLPKSISIERIKGIVFEAVRNKPKDMAKIFATPPGQASFVSAVIRSAKVGLAPDGQVAAIVPRRHRGVWMANFEPMWRGLAVLAYNSGQVKSIRGDYVYEKDYWEYEDGLYIKMVHRKAQEKDRGKLLCAWAVVETIHGGLIPKVVYQFDVDRARQGVKHSSNPHAAENQWDAEMWRKTAYKQALATAPMSDELRTAIVLDDLDSAGLDQGLIIDIEPVTVEAAGDGDLSDADLAAAMSAEAGAQTASMNQQSEPEPEPQPKPVQETKQGPPPQQRQPDKEKEPQSDLDF